MSAPAYDKTAIDRAGRRAQIKRFGLKATGFIASCVLPTLVGLAVGYHRGHESGRTEMKCAIFAIVEGMGDGKPLPGTISLGCDKRK